MRVPVAFEAPEPMLDGETFMALLQARRKAIALLRPSADALRDVAVVLREQSEESQPIPRALPEQKPSALHGQQHSKDLAPAPAKQVKRTRPVVDKAARRAKKLEAQRAEATEHRDAAAKSLAAQQQQLAEVRERLEKLNEDKHELVLQLKQALQQEGSLKRQATQGSLLSPRPGVGPGMTSPEGSMPTGLEGGQAGPDVAPQSAPIFSSQSVGMGGTTPVASQPGIMVSPAQPHFGAPPQPLQGRRDGRGRPWGSDESDPMEEGEVAPSPQRAGAWHDAQSGMGSSGPMRGAWMPPGMQSPGMMPRQPSWGQQPPPPPPGGASQLPPHLARQNQGGFQQGGYGDTGMGGPMRGRLGHAPPAPSWGSRDGPGSWQGGGGRRGPYS